MKRRKEKNDIKELKHVYDAYKEYIIKHGAAINLDNRYRPSFFLFNLLITIASYSSISASQH